MKEVGGGYVVYASREEERRINWIAGTCAAVLVIAVVIVVAVWAGLTPFTSSF